MTLMPRGWPAGWLRRLRHGLPELLGGLIGFALLLGWPVPQDRLDQYSTSLWSADGQLLGAKVSSDGQWRFGSGPEHRPADDSQGGAGDQLSAYFQALVRYEDHRFFGHLGLDTRSLVRALRDNSTGSGIVSGASTLSMQTARLLYGNRERTYGQKLRELLAALRLELRYDKQSLLRLYATLAPFGANVVGIEAASFRWFGRSAGSLTWAEAALLAVLPNSPALIHPGRDRDRLLAKRDRLLERLAEHGQFDQETLILALSEPLPAEVRPLPQLAPHLVDAADSWTAPVGLGRAATPSPEPSAPHPALLSASGDGRVLSSLDYRLQQTAIEVCERHARVNAGRGIGNLAVVVLRVTDGRPVISVGNVQPDAGRPGSYIDLTQSGRSTGSLLKPFLYAAMLDTGELTPSRLLPDIPTRIGSYSPENHTKQYLGGVRADEALAKSLNVPFVRLLRAYGVERFGQLLVRLGYRHLHRQLSDYGLPLILGGAEHTLLEAAEAYRHLALCASGNTPNPLFSAGAAWLTLQALVEVSRPGEDASWQHFASSRNISWKTGTSFGNKDAWAIGLNPEYVVAVWTGNADGSGRPELRGTDIAAPLMFELFQLLGKTAWFERPAEGLKLVTVCADSGYIAGPDCPAVRRQAVPQYAHVDSVCPYCRPVHLSADRRYQVTRDCAPGGQLVSENRFVLPPVMEWYYARANLSYRQLPPWQPGCRPQAADLIDLVVPEDHTSLYIPVELDGSPGVAVFHAVHRDPGAVLYWHLDDRFLASTVGDHRIELRPSFGEHLVTVVDGDGNRLSRRFFVLSE